MITIRCNGQNTEVPEGCLLSALVEQLGVSARRYAVELNRQVVARERLGQVSLAPGDEVNIVTLVGGG